MLAVKSRDSLDNLINDIMDFEIQSVEKQKTAPELYRKLVEETAEQMQRSERNPFRFITIYSVIPRRAAMVSYLSRPD